MTEIMRVRSVLNGVAGLPGYSNLYFGPVDGTLAESDAVDLVAAFWNSMLGDMDNNITITVEGEVPIIEDTTGEIQDVVTVTGQTLAVFGQSDPLPFTTQALGRFITADFVNGRRVRGRMFVPGMCEISNALGVPTTTFITAASARFAGLVGDATAPLVIWSRPIPVKPPTTPPTFTRLGSSHVVTESNVWTQWASLRSRRD
jgi:hypothetical protein